MQPPSPTAPFFAHAERDGGDGTRLTFRCEGTQLCTLWSDDRTGHKLTEHRLTLASPSAALAFFDRSCDCAEFLGMAEHPLDAMLRLKTPLAKL